MWADWEVGLGIERPALGFSAAPIRGRQPLFLRERRKGGMARAPTGSQRLAPAKRPYGMELGRV